MLKLKVCAQYLFIEDMLKQQKRINYWQTLYKCNVWNVF